jgi:hypothetical protein
LFASVSQYNQRTLQTGEEARRESKYADDASTRHADAASKTRVREP